MLWGTALVSIAGLGLMLSNDLALVVIGLLLSNDLALVVIGLLLALGLSLRKLAPATRLTPVTT